MTVEVELPDGTVVEFPAGTDNATMEKALAGYAKKQKIAATGSVTDRLLSGATPPQPANRRATSAPGLAQLLGSAGLEGLADLPTVGTNASDLLQPEIQTYQRINPATGEATTIATSGSKSAAIAQNERAIRDEGFNRELARENRARNPGAYIGTTLDRPERTWEQAAADAAAAWRDGARTGVTGLIDTPRLGINALNTGVNAVAGDINALLGSAPGPGIGMLDKFEWQKKLEADADALAKHERQMTGSSTLEYDEENRPDDFAGAVGYMASNPGSLIPDAARTAGTMMSSIVPGSGGGTIAAQASQQAAMASDDVYDSLIAKGVAPDEARREAAKAFAPGLAVGLVAPRLVPGGRAIEDMLSGTLGRGTGGMLGRVAMPFIGEMPSEAGEEGAIQAIQNVYSRDPVGQGVGGASALGGALGGGMATGPASVEGVRALTEGQAGRDRHTLTNPRASQEDRLAAAMRLMVKGYNFNEPAEPAARRDEIAPDLLQGMGRAEPAAPSSAQPAPPASPAAPTPSEADIDAMLVRNVLPEELADELGIAPDATVADVRQQVGALFGGDAPTTIDTDRVAAAMGDLAPAEESMTLVDFMRAMREEPTTESAPAAPPAATATPASQSQPAQTLSDASTTMQNRDRSRPASVAQMQGIRKNPDPQRLGFSRDPNTGAPMIGEGMPVPDDDVGRTDSVVMQQTGRTVPVRYAVVEASQLAASHDADGRVNPDYESAPLKALNNGRVAGLQGAWKDGNANAYREGIAADAGLHGVSAEAIASKREPVLVRLYDPALNTGDMGAESNASAQLGLSPVEQAQTDARGLPDLTGVTWAEDGTINPASNANFFRAWFKSMGDAQAASLQDAQGRPNAAALQRVRSAMVQKAYGDERLLTAMAEETNPDNRNVMNALAQAAPAFVSLDDSNAVGKEIRDALVGGLEILRDASRRGLSPGNALSQGDLLGRNADIDAVASYMADNARSAKRMAEAFKLMAAYASSAEQQAATMDVFGDAPQPTVGAAIQSAGMEGQKNEAVQRDEGAARSDRPSEQREQVPGREAAGDASAAGSSGGVAVGKAQESEVAPASAPSLAAGLFGAPTAREVVDSAKRDRDAKRDGRTGAGRTDMLSGDGELFAGNRPAQDVLESVEPAQTETPAFKRWFGDSVVVDGSGKPLIVYHGAPDARFMDADATFMSMSDRYGKREGVGAFWFARDRSTASSYADDRRAFDYQNADPAIIPAYIKLENPLLVDGRGRGWREAQSIGKTTDVIEKAQSDGHDGVIIRNVRDNYNNNSKTKATDTYVVFNSRQIKSADKNSGAFDPDSGNVLESVATESRDNGEGDAEMLGLRTAINDVLGPLGKDVIYLHGLSGLPENLRTGVENRLAQRGGKGRTAALYDTKTEKVYLFTDVVTTPERAAFHAAHEIAGHHGLRKLLGDKLHPALEIALQNPTVMGVAEAIARERKINMRTQSGRMLAAEEALAELAAAVRSGDYAGIESRYKVKVPEGIRNRVQAAINNFVKRLKALLNGMGAGKTFTDADVRALLENAWQAANGESTVSTLNADGSTTVEQVVFHGTPHKVDRFSLQKIGTGEGNQAYGYGLYFASQREVADAYRDSVKNMGRVAEINAELSRLAKVMDAESIGYRNFRSQEGRDAAADYDRLMDERSGVSTAKGNLYQVEVPENSDLLDYDNPLRDQSAEVIEKLEPYIVEAAKRRKASVSRRMNSDEARASIMRDLAKDAYADLAKQLGGPRQASERMMELGIPGLRYLDGDSRAKGGTHNYVIWDEAAIGTPEALESAEGAQPQTEAPAFKRWFGDSKVVDEEGKPLVVYHGGGVKGVQVFDPNKAGSIKTSDWGRGVYFTPKKWQADGYREDAAVSLDSENDRLWSEYLQAAKDMGTDPMSASMDLGFGSAKYNELAEYETRWRENRERLRKDKGSGEVYEVYLSIKNPLYEQYGGVTDPFLSGRAKDGGHDGIIIQHGDGSIDEVVVFSPSQIKSATGNRGTFDPDSDSILESVEYTPEQREFMDKAGVGADTRTTWGRVKDWAAGMKPDIRTDELLQATTDRYYGLKQATAKARLEIQNDPYVATRMVNMGSTMEAILRFGAPKMGPDGALVVDRSTQGLFDSLTPVHNDLAGFFGWMVARRAQLLKGQGRENLMSDADIAAGLSLRSGKEAQYDEAARGYLKLKNAILDFAEQHGSTIDPVARAAWDHAEYIPFFREGDSKGAGTRAGIANQAAGIKRLRGGEQQLKDPLSNIVENFTRIMDSALKNRAMLMAVDNLGAPYFEKVPMKMGQATIPMDQVKRHLLDSGVDQATIDAMPSATLKGVGRMMSIEAPTDDDVVRVMRNGKAEYYRVLDPLVLRSITSMQEHFTDELWMLPLKWTKTLLTAGATATVGFMVRNGFRDTAEAAITAREHFIPVWDTMRGAIESVRETEFAQDLMMAGSYFHGGLFHQGDFEATSRATKRALRKHGMSDSKAEKFAKTLINPKAWWDTYRTAQEATEMGSRVSLARNRMAATGNFLEAAFEAKDFLDFQLKGDAKMMQRMIQVLPFLNARMQGNYRVGRAALTMKDRRRVVLARLAMVAVNTAMLYAWNMLMYRDEYDELPEWEKDLYWHIAPNTPRHVRIPKPFELGLIAGTGVERGMAAIVHQFSDGKDGDRPEQSWAALLRGLMDTLALNPVPQGVKPGLEVFFNYDTFGGRKIESDYERRKAPADRKGPRTSTIAIQASKGMEAIMDDKGLSPKQIEHLWRGYTAGTGMWLLGMADRVVENLSGAPERPASSSRDWPGIGAIYRGDGVNYSTRYSDEFYSLRDEADKRQAAIKASLEEGNTARAERIEKEYRWLLGQRIGSKQAKGGFSYTGPREIARLGRVISKMRKADADVYASRSMTPAQKRETLEANANERNDMMMKAVRQYREAERKHKRSKPSP